MKPHTVTQIYFQVDIPARAWAGSQCCYESVTLLSDDDIDVDESLSPDLFPGSQADPDPAADRADRLPPAKQPDGVLVYGGLGPP